MGYCCKFWVNRSRFRRPAPAFSDLLYTFLEITPRRLAQNNAMSDLSGGEKVDDIFSCSDAIHECDGQADGRTYKRTEVPRHVAAVIDQLINQITAVTE